MRCLNEVISPQKSALIKHGVLSVRVSFRTGVKRACSFFSARVPGSPTRTIFVFVFLRVLGWSSARVARIPQGGMPHPNFLRPQAQQQCLTVRIVNALEVQEERYFCVTVSL